jgi:two-component system, cell cycle sensor histidine kinase and response regulator CckA
MENPTSRSEAQFRSLFDNSPYGIYRSSANGDRLLVANPALVKMLGYASETELQHVSLSKQLYVLSSTRQLVMESIQAHSRFEGDVEWKRKDGSFISVHLIAQAVADASGNDIEIEGTVEDLTSRRTLEQHLQRVQHLDSIGGLAGGMAHELNNLHMVISSYAEMLLSELKEAAERRKAEGILNASQRAATLIHQLLAFSRKQTLAPRVLDTTAALNKIAVILRGTIPENIEIVCQCEPSLGSVRVDPVQLQEVLANLASNAADAMPHGGRLMISAENATLSADQPIGSQGAKIAAGEYVLIRVADTGIGMDDETQLRAFEPFFTTKPVGEGTGLGLSSVYGIVKQSGGWIQMESEIGKGATFLIYLPLVENSVADETISSQPPALLEEKAGMTILLVEDEAGLREPVRDYLGKQGYRVLEASNGAEALDIVAADPGRIDALVTDVIMPQVNGPELAARLKDKFPEMKVIFMSGYAEDKLGGPEAFRESILLQKPFTLRALRAKLQELLLTSLPV